MDKSISDVLSLLKKNGNEEYARRMKAYLKGRFDLYGVKAPDRKLLIRPFLYLHKKTDYEIIKEMTFSLWNHPYRDAQYVAMDLLSKHIKKLQEPDISFIEYLITIKSWWDTVDWISSHLLGEYFKLFPQNKLEHINRFVRSGNIWLIRSTIIHQLFYREKTDRDLLAALILEQKKSKEFFINKASGWALRQYSKTNPVWVKDFISEYTLELSNLTIKEGMKWINKNLK